MMKLKLLLLACAGVIAFGAEKDFNGSWDIQVNDEVHPRAWWLKIVGAGTNSPGGEFVSAYAGDLNHIDDIAIHGNELVFGFVSKVRVPGPSTAATRHVVYKARLEGGELRGTFQAEGQDKPAVTWTGVRAPLIKDKDDGSWRDGESFSLFNGRDLSGWHALESDREFRWSVNNGLLRAPGHGANLVTDQKFWNFRLHLEYRIPAGSNSGIGLRARYEVQIKEDYGKPPDMHSNGALYSRIAPRLNPGKPAGEWQSYDIRLIGREVTVILNGEKIIDKGEIAGLTAIASDPNEAEPGPVILQGDHGSVEFRNITLTTLVKR
jgi:hypothetical protein